MALRRPKPMPRQLNKVNQLNSLDLLESRVLLSTVTVNAGTPVGAVNTQMLGVNLATWDGLLVTNPQNNPVSPNHPLNTQSVQLTQAAGLNAFRLPGGSTSDVYHWDIPNGGPSVNGGATFVDMANFVAGLNATASSMVTINYGTGSPEEGAAELAYLNGVPSAALNNVAFNVAGDGLTFSASPSVTISSLTSSGTTATATVTSTANLFTGETVTIAGTRQTAYNGAKVITVLSNQSFTYSIAAGQTSPATTRTSLSYSTSGWVQGGVTESGQAGPSWQTAGFWATLRTQTPADNPSNSDGLNFLRIGRTAPFAFHYWEVSNEEYGSWETDDHGQTGDTLPMPAGATRKIHDPTTYVAFAKQFANFAAQIDPTISTGFSTQSTNTADFSNWLSGLLTQFVAQGWTPGFVSDHIYAQSPGGESDSGLLSGTTTLRSGTDGTNGTSNVNTYDIQQRTDLSQPAQPYFRKRHLQQHSNSWNGI